MGQNNYGDLLYAQTTALTGFAQVFNLGGGFGRYNPSLSGDQADALAMASDWYAVVDDLNQAYDMFNPAESETSVGSIRGR